MKTKFTQGTWHSHDGQIYPEQTGKTICLIPYYDKDNEEQQANTKLICASPLLLEALIKINILCADASNTVEGKLNIGNIAKISIEAINQATN